MVNIAVSIALLPSEEVMEMVIKANSIIDDRSIALGKNDYIPHITLAMGVIDESEILEVKKIIKEISAKFLPIELTIESVRVKKRPDGPTVSGLEIKKSEKLLEMHNLIMDRVGDLFSYDANPEMFYGEVSKLPISWVKGFAKNSVREKYHPHITIGLGESTDIPLPIKFDSDTMVLCHLGDYCTCRKLL